MQRAERIRERAAGGPARLHVGVLLGGDTSERVVSLASGIAAGDALARRGHRITLFDPATLARVEAEGAVEDFELARRLGLRSANSGLARETVPPDEARQRTRRMIPSLTVFSTDPVDVVLNLLHGGAGEGGVISGVLDLLGMPYVGSDAISSAIAMDKAATKAVLREHGVPVAPHLFWREPFASPPEPAALAPLGGYPVVVKPLAEGSTVGITIVRGPGDWGAAAENGVPHAHPTRGLLVERYVPGRELTVGVVAGEVLPVVEIVPKEGFYDFQRKYTKGASSYLVPAPIEEGVAARLTEHARTAFREIGCRDFARIDFRVSEEGEIACLEVNTVPGMTETSLLPMAARSVGIEFGELLELLCRVAHRRARGADRPGEGHPDPGRSDPDPARRSSS